MGGGGGCAPLVFPTALVLIISYDYHPPTKLRGGNVFTGVCHFVQRAPGPLLHHTGPRLENFSNLFI